MRATSRLEKIVVIIEMLVDLLFVQHDLGRGRFRIGLCYDEKRGRERDERQGTYAN